MKKYFLFLILLVFVFAGCDNSKDIQNDNPINNSKNEQAKLNQVNKQTTISGAVTFSGLKPEPGDSGDITIMVRKHGTGEVFKKVNLSVSPELKDGTAWTWGDAIVDDVYDIQALLTIDGKEIALSDIATATAPAKGVELPLRVTWSKLPLEGREKSFKKISGDIIVSGYVPEGATVTIYTAKSRDNSELQPEEVDNPLFVPVVKRVSASNDKKWYWDEALGQIDYLVKSELYSKEGTLIGVSDIVHAIAPDENVTMNITSSAQAPQKDVTISGFTRLDGSYKSDSTIIVSVRENGMGGFNEVASFPAESDKIWEFNKAKSGVSYDVRAVLMHKDNEIARSKQKHTVAPAKDIKLKISTGLDLDDPIEKPFLVECKKKGSKKYDAKITFPGIGDARAYWIKVGTKKHSANRFNEPEHPDNVGEDLTIKLRVDKDKDYYAEYAYSYCKDCTTLDSYSDFSSHVKFSCPE